MTSSAAAPLTLNQAYDQALGHFNAGRFFDAARLCTAILETAPQSMEGLNLMAATAQRLHQHHRAVELFQRAIALHPQSAMLYGNLGLSLHALGRRDEAVAALQSALEREPDNAQLQHLQQQMRAAPAMTPLAQIALSPSLRKALTEAEALLASDQLETALEKLQEAQLHEPEHPVLLNSLGSVHARTHQEDEAFRHFQQALAQRPDYAEVHFKLGNLLHQKDQLEDAAVSYQEATALRPDYVEAHFNLGNTLAALKRPENASEQYRKAIAIDPNQARIHYNLAVVQERLKNGKDALEAYQAALHLDPDFTEAEVAYRYFLSQQASNWHFPMMNDTARNDAYEAALRDAVSPDTYVLDIGTGSGLLSMMAARAGARQVAAIEAIAAVADVARKIIDKNGYGKQITVINKESTALKVGVDLPRRADLLVTETFDVGLLGERAISFIEHAREHLLTPEARIIPQGATLFGALYESEALYKMGKVEQVSGFDLSPFNIFTTGYIQLPIRDYEHRFLSDALTLFEFDFTGEPIKPQQRSFSISINNDGTCHGVVFWFRLALDEKHVFDTSEAENPDNCWQQAVHVFDRPVAVKAGGTLHLTVNHKGHGKFKSPKTR